MLPSRLLLRPLSRPTISLVCKNLRAITPQVAVQHGHLRIPSIGLPAAVPKVAQRQLSSKSAATQPVIPEFTLADKVIIVTGGARGIGLQQATAALESGATVYAFDLPPQAPQTFLSVAERFPQKFHYRNIDVRDPDRLGEVVQEIGKTHDRLDGLIAAAGINNEITALDYTKPDWQRMFDINVLGVFLSAQAVAREMVRLKMDKGSIVCIASMSARIANRGLICSAYNASKAAVAQLVRGLAAEWGAYGIRVNSISPGYCVTEMVEQLFIEYPERRVKWPTENMLGRLSKPEEYRGAAVFLLSDASSFMTGADLLIDGGHSAW